MFLCGVQSDWPGARGLKTRFAYLLGRVLRLPLVFKKPKLENSNQFHPLPVTRIRPEGWGEGGGSAGLEPSERPPERPRPAWDSPAGRVLMGHRSQVLRTQLEQHPWRVGGLEDMHLQSPACLRAPRGLRYPSPLPPVTSCTHSIR